MLEEKQGVKKPNIDGFDLIKALAVSLIVFHHYQQRFELTFAGPNFFGGSVSFGYLVELFFLISGFVALYTFKDAESKLGGAFRDFLLPQVLCA